MEMISWGHQLENCCLRRLINANESQVCRWLLNDNVAICMEEMEDMEDMLWWRSSFNGSCTPVGCCVPADPPVPSTLSHRLFTAGRRVVGALRPVSFLIRINISLCCF